jgi:hypothetical protein
MRVVIDTNCLQSDELRAFLSASSDHKAVLPDYVLMEAYKPSRLDGLQAAFSVLSQFPRQVIALHGTASASALDPGAVVMAEAMISAEETEAFQTFCERLRVAGSNRSIARALEERSIWAQEQMGRMLDSWSDSGAAMAEFSQRFTAQELRAMRQGQPTAAIFEKFMEWVELMAIHVFQQRPEIARPSPERLVDHFAYRNALSLGVLMISHLRDGRVSRKPARARNDAIDVLLAAYGTYFDGVMSEDALTNEAFHVARDLLGAAGATIGGHYLEHFGSPRPPL